MGSHFREIGGRFAVWFLGRIYIVMLQRLFTFTGRWSIAFFLLFVMFMIMHARRCSAHSLTTCRMRSF